MKRLVSMLGICLIFSSSLTLAQDTDEMQDENEVFVVYRMTPDNSSISDFEDAWNNHNQKFHQESPVLAFYLESGPYAGQYQGVEGPKTWTGHENFEYTDEHGRDWLENVQPLLNGVINVEWWSHMKKYAQNESDQPTETSIVTIYHIKNGEFARFSRLLDDWMEANAEQNYDGRYNVYQRQLHGEAQVAIVSSLDRGLAELDESNELQKRIKDTHGESSWQLFLDDYELSVNKSQVAVRTRLPEVSTQQN